MGKCNEYYLKDYDGGEDVHEDSNISCRFLRTVCSVNILFTSIIVTVCIVDRYNKNYKNK